MERRVIAAIALSIAILFAFRYYEERRLAQMPRPPASKAVQLTPAPAAPPEEIPKPEAAQAAKPAGALPSAVPEVEVPARTVVVEGDLYRAVLDNRGGVLTSWQLNRYKTAKGEIFDMVPSAHMEERPFPASLVFDDPDLTALANGQNYSVEILDAPDDGSPLKAPATVVLRLRRGDLSIEKRFHFEADNYLVDFSGTFQRGDRSVRGSMVLGQDIGPEQEHLLNPSTQLQAVADVEGKVRREKPPKNEKEIQTVSGNILWVGLDMQYFAEIAVPSQPISSYTLERIPVQGEGLNGKMVNRDLIRMTVPANGSAGYRLYLGPKVQSYLQSVPGADLGPVINFGMFSILVRPLLVGLKFIDQYTRNYGTAIIVLTFILTILLFPFRLKQMVSMKKMQVLQPKIKEIQERYRKYKKTDPKRAEMNQEIMSLYKEHNVNPLGGCLPLILQMPLLFAFYSLLSSAIDLRQAPFVGWIHDLSAKDPYYILPIVMGVTMLVSQKITPMSPSTDPTQAKMMMIMPVVFTVFFLNVSSGLNLYFLCSNVFQIAFQKIAERWVGDKRPVRKGKSQ